MLMTHMRNLAALVPGWPAHGLVIADLTALPRFGLRGVGAADWLQTAGVDLPERPNLATISADGLLCLRLGANDITLSGPKGTDLIAAQWETAEGRNGVNGYRRNTWAHLAISGTGKGISARDMMAQLTAVDLRDRSLPAGAIAQTKIFEVDAVIIRSDFGGTQGYEIFFDIATRPFMLDSLHHLAPDAAFVTLTA